MPVDPFIHPCWYAILRHACSRCNPCFATAALIVYCGQEKMGAWNHEVKT
jgi:hypothetical protein